MLTKIDIDALEAGPETNALVAEEVMGLVRGVDFGIAPAHQWQRAKDSPGQPAMWAYQDPEYPSHGPRCTRCHLRIDMVYDDLKDFNEQAPDLFAELDRITPEPCDVPPEHYSTNIALAWLVVEALAKQRILIWPEIAPAGNYGIVVKQMTFRELYRDWWEKVLFTLIADTAPLGICRAALLAKQATAKE